MGLAFVELIIDIEQRFGIEIPDPVANRLRTPRQLIDHVCTLVGERWTRREVAEAIRQLVGAQSGFQSFSDDDDFVRDLDMG